MFFSWLFVLIVWWLAGGDIPTVAWLLLIPFWLRACAKGIEELRRSIKG